MILSRKAYRGHYIEIRSEQAAGSTGSARYAQVWVDGERLDVPHPCRDTHDLDHLLDGARSRIDAFHFG